MVFKVRYQKLGGHYHMRVFVARQTNQTYGKMGDLVCSEAEFEDFRLAFSGAAFVPEEREPKDVTV
jgi:hypothetical protein